MKYEDVRRTIRSGDVLLWSRRSGLGANLIRIFTRSQFTHVGLAWVVAGRVFVLEAYPGQGVRLHLLSSLSPFYILKSATDIWNDEMETYALSKLSESYSYLEAVRGYLGLAKIDAKWECAEFVQYVRGVVDTGIWKVRPTPGNIAEYILSTPGSNLIKVD